jgi:glycosyltransferase involved in cell wall biosynthesis
MAPGVASGWASVRPVVFDLRAGGYTGIGRVASETVAAYRAAFPHDPVTVLTDGGARYSLQAQREWPALRRAHPNAVWVWFHWDVPWVRPPARSLVYIHDLIVTDPAYTAWPKRAVARWWMGRAVQMASRAASRLVTVSAASAAVLREAYGTEATVIPNGVADRWRGPWTGGEARSGANHFGDYLLTVGEPRGYKNLALAQQVAAALGVRHRHAWRVADDELALLYAGARVVLVPSRVEGFGLPLLEAFAAGVPVVASDIPALREVGGTLATYASPNDLDGWCHAVRAAWDDGGNPEARRAWAATFTWDRAARQLRGLVASL